MIQKYDNKQMLQKCLCVSNIQSKVFNNFDNNILTQNISSISKWMQKSIAILTNNRLVTWVTVVGKLASQLWIRA